MQDRIRVGIASKFTKESFITSAKAFGCYLVAVCGVDILTFTFGHVFA